MRSPKLNKPQKQCAAFFSRSLGSGPGHLADQVVVCVSAAVDWYWPHRVCHCPHARSESVIVISVSLSFDSHTLCQIAWLVHIQPAHIRDVVRQKLQWHHCQQGDKTFLRLWNAKHVLRDIVKVVVVLLCGKWQNGTTDEKNYNTA